MLLLRYYIVFLTVIFFAFAQDCTPLNTAEGHPPVGACECGFPCLNDCQPVYYCAAALCTERIGATEQVCAHCKFGTRPNNDGPAAWYRDDCQEPAEPTPAEPTPAEPTPAEPTPAEPTPAEPTPNPVLTCNGVAKPEGCTQCVANDYWNCNKDRCPPHPDGKICELCIWHNEAYTNDNCAPAPNPVPVPAPAPTPTCGGLAKPEGCGDCVSELWQCALNRCVPPAGKVCQKCIWWNNGYANEACTNAPAPAPAPAPVPVPAPAPTPTCGGIAKPEGCGDCVSEHWQCALNRCVPPAGKVCQKCIWYNNGYANEACSNAPAPAPAPEPVPAPAPTPCDGTQPEGCECVSANWVCALNRCTQPAGKTCQKCFFREGGYRPDACASNPAPAPAPAPVEPAPVPAPAPTPTCGGLAKPEGCGECVGQLWQCDKARCVVPDGKVCQKCIWHNNGYANEACTNAPAPAPAPAPVEPAPAPAPAPVEPAPAPAPAPVEPAPAPAPTPCNGAKPEGCECVNALWTCAIGRCTQPAGKTCQKCFFREGAYKPDACTSTETPAPAPAPAPAPVEPAPAPAPVPAGCGDDRPQGCHCDGTKVICDLHLCQAPSGKTCSKCLFREGKFVAEACQEAPVPAPEPDKCGNLAHPLPDHRELCTCRTELGQYDCSAKFELCARVLPDNKVCHVCVYTADGFVAKECEPVATQVPDEPTNPCAEISADLVDVCKCASPCPGCLPVFYCPEDLCETSLGALGDGKRCLHCKRNREGFYRDDCTEVSQCPFAGEPCKCARLEGCGWCDYGSFTTDAGNTYSRGACLTANSDVECSSANDHGFSAVADVCDDSGPGPSDDGTPDAVEDGVAKCLQDAGCADLSEINKVLEDERANAGDDSILKTHVIVIIAIVDANEKDGIVSLFVDAFGPGPIEDDRRDQICDFVIRAVSSHLKVPESELEDCRVELVQTNKRQQDTTTSYVATFRTAPPQSQTAGAGVVGPVVALLAASAALVAAH